MNKKNLIDETTKQYKTCIKDILSKTFKDKKIWFSFVSALILLGVGILANLLTPFLLKKIIENFSEPNAIPITLILLSYGLIWTISQGAIHLRGLLTYKIEQRITYVLGVKVITHLYSLSQGYFLNQKPGALTSVIRKAQQNVPILILGMFFHVFPTFLEFLFVIILVYSLYPILYSLLIAGVLITFSAHTFFFMQTTSKAREKANEIDKKVDGAITDWLSNYEAIKIFGQQDLATHICEGALKERENAEIMFMTKFSYVRLGQSLILGIGFASLTYYIGQGVLNGTLNIGDFVLFNGYVLQFIIPMSIFGQVIQEMRKALTDMKGIINLLLTETEVKQSSHPVYLSGSCFQINFEHVFFKYDERHILNDISFQIDPGETILIVGPTGIGKSTIAKLLLRLYDPTKGQIFINHINIKEIAFQSLYKTIGWVPQETYLLNDSIKNNIQFAQPNASLNEIERALDYANLLDFVRSVPQGIDTIVGDRGLKLSGGEKQRLSLARLFLKKPQICIFDESTASLDKNTDLLIQENIEKYLPGMTKIIITHRPFTINKAHKVINIDGKNVSA